MNKKVYLFAIFFLLFSLKDIYGQQNSSKKTAIGYLIKNLLLINRDTGAIVLLPISANDIKSYSLDIDSKYWEVLKKYYPDLPRDSLIKRVETSDWVDTSMKLSPFRLYFPKVHDDKNHDLAKYSKQYNASVFFISNLIYSPDGMVCVVYIRGYQQGAFTVEIFKNSLGEWSYLSETTDFLE